MAMVIAGRVKETTSVTGASTMTLLGAATGFRAFGSAIGTGNQTHYFLTDSSAFEAGIGTVTVAGSTVTLSRDTVLYSSQGGAQIAFGAGTKTVFSGLDGNASSIRGGLGVEFGPGLQNSGSVVTAGFSVVSLTGATALVAADSRKLFDCNGQFTITLASTNVLGAGWRSRFNNSGASTITVTGSALSLTINPGSCPDVLCIGSAFRVVGTLATAQAGMEAPSSNDTVVPPRFLQNHPGVSKFWSVTNASSPASLNAGYNFSSFGTNGTGDYSLIWSTAFATTSYCAVALCDQSTGLTVSTFYTDIHTKATTSLRVLTYASGTGQFPVAYLAAACWGDQ